MEEESASQSIPFYHDWVLESRPAVQASLAATRRPRAVGPGSEIETLRRAYLDLLKLCLCDLAGPTTGSVGTMPEGGNASRVLRGQERQLRSAGLDWPLQGLTMIGLRRLDDLQSCVESVARGEVEGDLVEAGAWRGGASILMRATLDVLGETDRTVWVADSFQGFPKARDAENDDDPDLSEYDFLAVPLDEVRNNFARLGFERGVRFVPGFFEETLAGLSHSSWAVVRLDADTYEATWTALQSLYPGLSVGGYLIVDDYLLLEECREAVDEFRRHNAITEPLEEVDYSCVRWTRERAVPIKAPPPGVVPQGDGGARPAPAERPSRQEVPTTRELALAHEIELLRGRLASAEAETAQLRRSPLRRAAGQLRGRLRRRRMITRRG